MAKQKRHCDESVPSGERRLSAEERAVAEMVLVTDEHITPEDTCRALYRAGYRKIENQFTSRQGA